VGGGSTDADDAAATIAPHAINVAMIDDRSARGPPSMRHQPATVLASVKGKAAPAVRPPLTCAARDGRLTGDRVGGMIRDPIDQRDDDK